MIFLVVVWVITFLFFLPFGVVVSHFINYLTKDKQEQGIIECFLLGIVSLSTVLIILNYFIPINIYLMGALCILAILIYIFQGKRIYSKLQKSTHQFLFDLSFFRLIVLFLALVGIVLFSLSYSSIYDTDLYHLQYMRWITEYKIIPGLGNLHGRFAFNSSFLVISSLFYNLKAVTGYIFPLNSLIAIMLLINILKNWKQRNGAVNGIVLMMYIVFGVLCFQVLSSTSTDLTVNLIIMYLMLYWYDSRDFFTKSKFIYILFLSLFCVTLKISSICIMLLPLFLCLYYRNIILKPKMIGLIVIIACIILLPWIGRYIVMSGYLIYPFDKIDIFSFDWKMPKEMLVNEKNAVYAWARVPGWPTEDIIRLPFSEWVVFWFEKKGLFKNILFILAFISPIVMLFTRTLLRYKNKYFYSIWAICFIGTMYLFFTAPDFRFGAGFVIVSALIPYIGVFSSPKFAKFTFVLNIVTFVLCIILLKFSYNQLKFYNAFRNEPMSLLVIHPQKYGLFQEGLEYNIIDRETYKIYYPNRNDRCFDHYLPCTPYPNENLHFRGDRIEDGFYFYNKEK